MRSTIDISKKNIGVNIHDGKGHIKLWSPLSSSVSIAIEDTNQDISLDKKDFGYWELVTDKVKENTSYKFIIEDKNAFPDPASLSQPNGVHAASCAIDLNYKWTDNSWQNPALEDYIIYEIHTGTFTNEGTFEGIEKKIPHLKELGITAIEIMPVAAFPGDRNWGYDGVYPFAVQTSYGGAKGLQQLVDRCHANGIAVILDVVYNHLGPEGNYFDKYGPYFTDKYATPWGNAINFDDAWCDGVRDFYIENALMWLRDFHIDALRLDAVHAIKDLSTKHILREIREYVDQLQLHSGKKHYLIVESDLNDPKFIEPINKNGYGMDAQWTDEFHHALRTTAGEKKRGYYSDFNGIEHLAKAFNDAYVYDGQFSEHRRKFFGSKTTNEGKQFIVFSQNHDQAGNRMMGERTSTLVSFEMQKLMAAAVIFSPYIPLLFMGEEWSEPHPFLYFVSHTDKKLAEAVRKGRKEEFADFQDEGEAPDPMLEETFRQSKLQWELVNEPAHKKMLSFYKHLVGLRKSEPVLRTTNRNTTRAFVRGEILVLERWNKSEKITCLMNFSKEIKPYDPIAGDIILDSADTNWGGTGRKLNDKTKAIEIQPESIILFKQKNV